MIVITSHTHAHRLLRGGTVESAPLHNYEGETVYRENEFTQLDPSVMNLTGADFEQIRIYLETLNNIIRPDYHLPSVEPQVVEGQFAGQPL